MPTLNTLGVSVGLTIALIGFDLGERFAKPRRGMQ
jgi:hypothetical protein